MQKFSFYLLQDLPTFGKLANLSVIVFLFLFLSGCATKSMDLRDFGIKASIEAPGGTTIQPDSLGTDVILVKEKAFRLRLSPQDIDLPSLKVQLAGNPLNRVKRWIKDESNLLMYESEIVNKTEFHFIGKRKLASQTVSCQDDYAQHSHTLTEIEIMWKSCLSME